MTFQIFPVPGQGAEDVVVAPAGPDEGAVFTGTGDGVIHRISHDGRQVRSVANTGGRPLGLEYLPDGRLLVCDAVRGVLAVDPGTGRIETLVGDVDGRQMRFCNNAAVAANGTVYFSDSSTVYGIAEWKNDFVERTSTGRLLRCGTDGRVQVLLDGLCFANGVALAADESFVAVAETAARTVVRYWLTGPRAGTRDFLVRDLAGYPDNIARGSDGLIWVSLASPRDPVVERLQRSPVWIRRRVTRIPAALQPVPKRTVRVQAYDDAGALVHDRQPGKAEHQGRYHMVTGVREHDGRVWLGSLHEPAVAVLSL
jgi:sugar lactone lactonase YvrE